MYRAVALAGLRRGVDWQRPGELAELAGQVRIALADDCVLLGGEDVTEAVRSWEVTSVTRYAAGNPAIRRRLAALQRAAAQGADVVTEGRDQGTVVFSDADYKIYLTAGPEERARRRWRDLQAQGKDVALDEVLASINRRDEEDASREVGPLAAAPDAIRIATDGLTAEQVVDRLAALVMNRDEG
jgi:cytidylate kinase